MSKQARSLFLWCLVLCLPAAAQSQSAIQREHLSVAGAEQPSKIEQHLRERCERLYTAIQKGLWSKVPGFLNEDAKIAWAGMKKTSIYGFEIESVSVAADGKTGVTKVLVESFLNMPGFPGTKIRNAQELEWVWENEDWYALLRDRPREPLPPIGPGGVPQLAVPPPADPLPAELDFTSLVYDFKMIRRGETIHTKFYFTNKSDHVVKAKAASFNPCLCVTVRVSKEQFKPGEEGWVETTMDTKEFAGNIAQGLDVTLQPSGAKVTLQLRGYVLRPHENRDQK